jgi:hypothetical protein
MARKFAEANTLEGWGQAYRSGDEPAWAPPVLRDGGGLDSGKRRLPPGYRRVDGEPPTGWLGSGGSLASSGANGAPESGFPDEPILSALRPSEGDDE